MPHEAAQLRALAERIEGAEGASRNLDAEFHFAVVEDPGPRPFRARWWSLGPGSGHYVVEYADGGEGEMGSHCVKPYTFSLDACCDLHRQLLSDTGIEIEWWQDGHPCVNVGIKLRRPDDICQLAFGFAHGKDAQARAYAAAILRALAAQGEASHGQ